MKLVVGDGIHPRGWGRPLCERRKKELEVAFGAQRSLWLGHFMKSGMYIIPHCKHESKGPGRFKGLRVFYLF